MSKPSFFREMVIVDSCLTNGVYEVDGKLARYSKTTKSVFKKLVDYIESCNFTNASSCKLICANWRATKEELHSMFKSKKGVEKSDSTIRNQISNTSAILYDLFPTFSSQSFISEDKEAIYQIELTIGVLESSITVPEEVFVSEVCDYSDYRTSEKEFELSECSKELALLRTLTKSNIFGLLDTIDVDKLSFLLKTMLGKMAHLRNRTTNLNKVAIYKELDLVGSDSVFLEEITTSSSEDLVRVQDLKNSSPDYISSMEDLPTKNNYRFGLTEDMLKILESRLENKISTDNESKCSSDSLESMRKVLDLYTPEGFSRALKKVNYYDLALAVKDYIV